MRPERLSFGEPDGPKLIAVNYKLAGGLSRIFPSRLFYHDVPLTPTTSSSITIVLSRSW